jgi:hypothetical protein
MSGNSTLRSDELESGVVQRLGKLLATRLWVMQLQARLGTLVLSREVRQHCRVLAQLAQIIAKSGTTMANVASIEYGSCEFTCKLFEMGT